MKMKEVRKKEIKVGDRIKCSCCNEVFGTVTKVFKNERVSWSEKPYTGYEVKNDQNIFGGSIVVCDPSRAQRI